jgi:hypothetical protein
MKDPMKRNLKSRNLALLMDAIREHNHYSELTLECNKCFKYVLAIVYFIFTPIVKYYQYYKILILCVSTAIDSAPGYHTNMRPVSLDSVSPEKRAKIFSKSD